MKRIKKTQSGIYFLLLFCGMFMSGSLLGQDDTKPDTETEKMKRSNVVLSIGHSLIPEADDPGKKANMVWVPTWGLSYEFRFSHGFLLGLKSEIELSNYTIKDAEGTEIEREYPVSLILYADVRIVKDFYLYGGPGIEFEKEADFFIATLGAFYEVEIRRGWNVVPEISYKLKGGNTNTSAYSVGLGICKEF